MIEVFDATLPHGITLSCRASGQAGAGRPRVMCLHGFPEAAFVWDELLAALAPQARCIAPNLRGYERSSAPAELAAYKPRHLVADVVALIEQQGAPLDLLVAHDWGGALAWNLAAQRPDLLRRLLIINAPHPATFLRDLRSHEPQQQASRYMTLLCQDDAESVLAADDFAFLFATLRKGFGGSGEWLTEAVRAQYRAVWQQGLSGPLNYYRASPLRPPLGAQDAVMTLDMPDDAVTVRVPTQVLWGEGDAALCTHLLEGLERWVPQLQVQRVAQATHWIVHERPALVLQTVQRLLSQTTTN